MEVEKYTNHRVINRALRNHFRGYSTSNAIDDLARRFYGVEALDSGRVRFTTARGSYDISRELATAITLRKLKALTNFSH
jgi:DICT domain-containing protein